MNYFFNLYVRNLPNYYQLNIIQKMKKALLMLTLTVGLFSCSTKSNETNAETDTASEVIKDHVELVYFHGKQRCITCRAIEKYSREVVDSLNATGIPAGELSFRVVDINETKRWLTAMRLQALLCIL